MSAPLKRVRVGRVLSMAAALGIALGVGSALFNIHREEARERAVLQSEAATPHRPHQAPQPDPAALQGLPAYPGAEPLPLLSEPAGTGGELKAAWFSTLDSPDQVLSYYQRALEQQGRAVLAHRFGEGQGYAGYLDADGEHVHLIAVVKQGERTLVFPTSSVPEQLLERRSQAELPAPPNAHPAVGFSLGESGARSYYQTVSDTTVSEVLSFYRAALPQAGWQLQNAVEVDRGAHVEATKARQSATVSVQQKLGREVSISITIMGQV